MFSTPSEPGNQDEWPPNTGLGFLNPLFYGHPEAFNDIVGGSNPGCGTTGFPAMPGWDPVRPSKLVSFSTLADLVLHRSRVWEHQSFQSCLRSFDKGDLALGFRVQCR